jgi:CHAD domain
MPKATKNTTTRIGICLHAYVLQQFDLAGRSLGRSRERLHTGVHDARKAIRRIRATLDLGRARLWPAAGQVFDELRELCRHLSQVRDAHAVIETLDRLRKSAADAGQRELLKRIRKNLSKKHASAVSRLLRQDRGLRKLLVRIRGLREATDALDWSPIDADDIRHALQRSDRRAGRTGQGSTRKQQVAMRHRWRRRLRRLRHQMVILEAELGWRLFRDSPSSGREGIAAPEWKANVRFSLADLGHMTELLGHEHDLRLLRAAVKATTGIKEGDRSEILQLLRDKLNAALK